MCALTLPPSLPSAKQVSAALSIAGSPALVVNAITHAVTSIAPKTRYRVGVDSNFVLHPLSYCPSFIVDFLLEKAK